MAVEFFIQKGTDPEYNIEDYFAIRITSVRGLNPPQPKELFVRDWASEDGIDYFLAEERKRKSSEVIMTIFVQDSEVYNGMQVTAIQRYRSFCDYIFNGVLNYRDTLQNQAVSMIYNGNKPEWYQFVGEGRLMAEITFTNPTGEVTQLLPTYETPQKPDITSELTAIAQVPVPFTYTITADYNPTSFNAANLPEGLSVNTDTGVISGTPLVSGVFNCYISATNSYGNDIELLELTVQSA